MKVGKNQEIVEVAINRQLCMMLAEFEWSGFSHKTLRPVARMKEWLGVKGYSFKFAILTAAASASSDLRLPQSMAGHLSITSTRIYTQLALLADAISLTDKVIIPGLHPRFGTFDEERSQDFMRSLEIQNFRYQKFA